MIHSPPRTSVSQLQEKARRMRATCVQLAHDGREGHLNGALSSVDLLVALYETWLRVTPATMTDPDRDRFIFSKGHACTSLYAVLAGGGFFPMDWLDRYAENDSPLPSHPCRHSLPALEWSSGSLGHGLGVGTGICYSLRMRSSPARVAVLLSDGECNEGSTWEAAMFANAHGFENLLAVVDYNHTQSVEKTDVLTGGASFAEKFRAFGWGIREIDGHDFDAITEALAAFPFKPGKPSAIVASTVAGKGVSFMEDQILWHYRVPSDEEVAKAFEELGAQPIHTKVP